MQISANNFEVKNNIKMQSQYIGKILMNLIFINISFNFFNICMYTQLFFQLFVNIELQLLS